MKNVIKTSLFYTLIAGALVFFFRKLLDGIVGYGDNPVYWNFLLQKDYYNVWSDSFLGIDNSTRMFGLPFLAFIYFLFFTVFEQNTASYVYSFLPVLIYLWGIFHTSKKISKDNKIALFVTSFGLLNNYIIEQFVYWPGNYFWNLVFLLFLFNFFYDSINLKKITWQSIIILGITSVLITHPFFYVITIISILVYLFYYNFCVVRSSKNLFKILIGIITITLTQFYWIAPFIYSLFVNKTSASSTYAGIMNGVIDAYNVISTHINLLHFYNYPGAINQIINANMFQTFFYISVFIIVIILFYSKSKSLLYSNQITFFCVLIAIFFTLSLGSNLIIIGDLWQYGFKNTPFLGFFRSITRFHIVTLMSSMFLLSIALKKLKTKKVMNLIVMSWLFVLIILSNNVFFNGDFSGVISKYNLPKEYDEINDKYFNKRSSLAETIMAFPSIGYESYTWSINKQTEKFQQINYFKLYFFPVPIIYNNFGINLQKKYPQYTKLFEYDDKFKFYKGFDEEIKAIGIQYILLHKDLYDNLNKKVVLSERYKKHFDNNMNYLKMEENEYFILYKTYNDTRIVKTQNIHCLNQIDNTKYIVVAKDISNIEITFLQSYNKNWNLYIMEYNGNCDQSNKYKKLELVTHEETADGFNHWSINKDELNHFSNAPWLNKKGPNNTYNAKILIEYDSQKLFKLSIIVSCMNLILLNIALITIYFLKIRNNRRNNDEL